jgi:YHS domain-containing protein
MPVTYKGQTYYVCCTGCRDAFNETPEKYIKEFLERKAKAGKP